MREVTEFPHRVREVEHAWIPMPDGCRLAARLWLPECAEDRPVPAVFEYIPYLKRAGTRDRDEPIHRWFAGHGIAAARVEVRGTGESEGCLDDEYTERELADGEEVVRWLASRPWSNGRVGMIGKSWGGINALAIAARRPPALGAVISVCSTDDRFRTDAHYMGGRLLNENLLWGAALFGLATLPPDPELVGDRWRRVWRERLDRAPFYPEIWMRHPRRDAYWRHASVAEDYSAIRCPVYAVSGWADAYRGTVLRLLAGLTVPARGLIGPWAHVYPHDGSPGPEIGFLQECLRWWRRWLEDVDDGIMDEPRLRAWMPDGPVDDDWQSPGRWVAEERWPSPRIATVRPDLAPPPNTAPPGEAAPLTVRSPATTGRAAGAWCPFSAGETAREQSRDDAGSLVLDSPPLAGRLEILGEPVAELEIAADRPGGLAAVRLCDVAPDGTSRRVTYGLLDLDRQAGANARRRVRIALEAIGHAFRPGHRIRLALSTAYWPIAWPSPSPATLTLLAFALELPARPPRPEDAELPEFGPAEGAPVPAMDDLAEEHPRRERITDPETGDAEMHHSFGLDAGGEPVLTRYDAIGLESGQGFELRFRIRDGDPILAETEVRQQRVLRRGEWSVRVETRARLEQDGEGLRLRGALEAWEGEERMCSREWDARFPAEDQANISPAARQSQSRR